MPKHQGFIYVASTLDTKSAELFYVSDLIKNAGLAVRTVDLSTQPSLLEKNADVTAEMVASFHPQGAGAIFCGDRGKAIEAMAQAFSLYLAAQTDVAAILGLDGTDYTSNANFTCRCAKTHGLHHGLGRYFRVYRRK